MIEIEYIVRDSRGVERLRTADKKAADAYDRMLENAERLAQMLRADEVLPTLSDSDLEELTIYLSSNAQAVERVLKGKAPERDAATTSSAAKGADTEAADKVAQLKAAS